MHDTLICVTLGLIWLHFFVGFVAGTLTYLSLSRKYGHSGSLMRNVFLASLVWEYFFLTKDPPKE